MGEIGDAAGVHVRHVAEVQDLHQEPEADEKRGGDEGDPEKDEEEDEACECDRAER